MAPKPPITSAALWRNLSNDDPEVVEYYGAVFPNANSIFTGIPSTLTFIGWNTERDGSGVAYSEGDPLTSTGINCFAQYTSTAITATLYRNLTSQDTTTYTETSGTLPDPNDVFDDVTKVFNQWNTVRDGTGVAYAIGNPYVDSGTYYAIYDDPIKYVVTDGELAYVAKRIRRKGGTSSPLQWPLGFGHAVDDI